jgi:hypothetical protein
MLVFLSAISAFLASRAQSHYDKYENDYNPEGLDDRGSSIRESV